MGCNRKFPAKRGTGSFASRLLRGGRITKWKGVVASYAPFIAHLAPAIGRRILPAALLAGLAAGTAMSATLYWDPNGALSGRGGTGTWDTSSLFWDPSNAGVCAGPCQVWSNIALNDAVFGDDVAGTGFAGTVTIGAPIVVHNMTFEDDTVAPLVQTNYVINSSGAGNTLTLAGSTPTITILGDTNDSVTINAVIAGSAGLTKEGAGILRLNGANTFTGTVDVNNGQLIVNGNAALGAAGNVVDLAPGTSFGSTGALSASRVVNLSGSGQATLLNTGAGTTGVGSAWFRGTGGLKVQGNVALTNGLNDYTGMTQFDGQPIALSIFDVSVLANEGLASSIGAATGANATIVVNAHGNSGTAILRYTGGAGGTNRDWQLNSAGFFSAELRNSGSGLLTLTGDIVLKGATGTGVNINAETADIQIGSAADGSLGIISTDPVNGIPTLALSGSSTSRSIMLYGDNTYVGPTNITTVTARVDSLANTGSVSSLGTGTSLGTNAAVNITNGALSYIGTGSSSNRSWNINDAGNIRNDGSGALNLSGTVTFQAGGATENLTLGGSFAGVNILSGAISGTGNLIMNGAAGDVWELAGVNTYIGTVTVNGGTLRAAAGNSQAFGPPNALTVNSGTLDLNDNGTTFTSLTGTGGTVNTGALTTTDLTINGPTSTTYSGSITGAGNLIKSGTSTLTLKGQNTYTGDTRMNGGTLALDFTGAGGPTSDIISGTSTLVMVGGAVTVTGVSGENDRQTFDGLNIISGSNRVNATNATVDFGAINRTGGLVDFGLGAGAVFETDNALGNLGGWATVTTGTVTDYAKVIDNGGGTHIITAFTAADYVNQDDAGQWDSTPGQFISDAGGAANTAYFGAVDNNVQLAGLKYTAANTSNVTINSGVTLGIDGTIIVSSSVGATTKSIAGPGSLTGSTGASSTLGILHNGTGNFAISATIVNNGANATSFIKGGTGLVTLTGANTYTGKTTLSGGTLSVNSIGNGGVASAIGASTADSANLVLESGRLSYGGASAVTDRGFTLVNGGASREIEVAGGTTLEFQGLVTSADDAGFTKINSGTLVLSNDANDYKGVTRIEGGVLSVDTLANGGLASGIGKSSGNSANLVLTTLGGATTGTLRYTGATVSTDRGFTLAGGNGAIDVANLGTALTMSGAAIGTGVLNKEGAGTLILSGNNTYTGGTVVNAGTLRAGSVQAFGSTTATMTVNAGGTLDLNSIAGIQVGALIGGGNVTLGSATLTIAGANSGDPGFTGVISGTGGIIKTGGGTQVMTGCGSTYTGATIINSGVLSVNCLANGGQASAIGASSSAAANLAINGFGIFSYTGTSVSIDRGFSVSSGGGAAATFNVTDPTAVLEMKGDVTGFGGLVKGGAGTLMLSGNTAFTGLVAISAGTLRAGSTTALNNNLAIRLATAGTLDLNGQNNTVASLLDNDDNLATPDNGTVLLNGATLTINAGHGGTTSMGFSGVISGSGNLVKTGGNVQRLFGCNSTYTGTTTVSGGGTLAVSCLANGGSASSIGMSGAAAANLILNSGTLQYIGDGDTTDRLFTLGGTSAIDASGTGAIVFDNPGAIAFVTPNTNQTVTLKGASSADNSIAAQITNNGSGTTSLTKSESGTWILRNAASTYTGATTINGGVLGVDKLSNGGVASSIGASAGTANMLVIGSGATLRYTGTGDSTNRLFTLATGTSSIESSGTGAINFTNTGDAVYSGSGDRTLALGGTNTDTNTLGVRITNGPGGTTSLAKNGVGTWILTGNNTFTGNTTINAGNLVVGNGGTTGNVGAGNVIVNTPTSVLSFNRSNAFDVTGLITGTGSIAQIGTGTTTLTRNNDYKGTTTVQSGTLLINGDQSAATGDTSVLGGALGGTGTIGGDVTVADGATLRPGSNANGGIGTLTIKGDLALGNTSIVDVQLGQAGVVGGPQNDLISVTGNLTLNGTLNVTQGGSFGPGVYRIMSYGGTLDNQGLTSSVPSFYVQTSINGQVNLVNSQGLTLNFWDGANGPKNDGTIQGGNGTWQGSGGTANDNWTTATGTPNAPWTTAAIAIFGGAAGTVTVDNDAVTGNVTASGMQFLTNGYLIQGETITLVPNSANPGQSVIIVGDGTLAGAGITATISAALAGNTQLVKADLGTLILSGANSYTGGTAINGGVLQIANDGNLGQAGTALSFNGGTLRNTAAIVTARAVTLNAGGGTFDTQADLTLSSLVTGAGALTKTGTAILTLSSDNNYAGGTTISAGTLQLGTGVGGSAAGSITGNVLNNGTLAFNRSNDYLFAGTITGSGAVTQIGTGTTTLTADNTYSGGTTISAGALQLGNGGTTGSITGDVVNDSVLIFNRSNEYTFAGVISGTGDVTKRGTGTTILTGTNTYAGETTVEAGTLLVNGDQSGATGDTNVDSGATLGGIGIIGGDVTIANGGTLSPGPEGTVPGTLTINGNLVLNATSNLNVNFGQANVVGGQFNDHIVVQGSLTLDGTLNVTETPGGNFGPGIYRVISYDANDGFTDNGLTFNNPNFAVQTSIAGQVNLVNSTGLALSYWDGNTGPKDNDQVNGGNGTWDTGAGTDRNWTDQNGDINADYANGTFAIFAGVGGNVTVAGTDVQASGMQFATGGYTIAGGPIALVGDPASIIRVGDGTLAGAAFTATINSNLTGTTQLVKTDFGTLILGGANSYTGGTAINGGVLQVASDGNLGDPAGDLSFDTGTLRNTAAFTSDRDALLNAGGGTFETQADLTLTGVISGLGNLTKTGNGALILEGNNTYTGTTTVSAGSLIVDGDQSAATGNTTVNSAATLGGSGTIGGNVTVESGGILAPGGLTGTGVGTLTIAGNLTLNGGATLNYSFGDGSVADANEPGGGQFNDLVNVEGDLVLDGVINVTQTPGGNFGPGIYRVFNYSGQLTNNTLELGILPPAGNYQVLTNITGQVNLVNTAGLTLNYWDGENGGRNDGIVDGGDGIWRPIGDLNWTTDTGSPNASYSQASVAVFGGAAGTVDVVPGGVIQAAGMLFITDGYRITGGPVELVGGTSTIQVGDGNASSASYVAIIDSVLTGSSQLVKTDFGTLVLTGVNTYAGGTNIVGGTVQVSEDANLGDATGDVSFANDAVLHTTDTFTTGRDLIFTGAGTVMTDDGTILTVNGVLSGPGNFTKAGTGKMVLTADSSGYTATTDIDAGTLTVNGSLCGIVNVNAGSRLEGTGTVCDTNNNTGGTIAPGDGGIGTLTVDGDYVGGGTLEIETVLGGDSSSTDLLKVTGNTSGATIVTVENVGGGGAQTVEGIKIVDIDGTSAGTFSLEGDYVFQGEQAVIGGAYAYVLRKNGVSTPQDGDWYLRSSLIDDPGPGEPQQPIYAPTVPIYEAFAAILQEFDELETLQRRVGNRQWLGKETIEPAADVQGPSSGDKSDRIGVWARVKAGHAHLEPDKASTVDDYDVTSWKIQGGADALLSDSDSGSLIGGLALHFGTASASVDSFFGNGNIDVIGYGISGALTWYGVGGFYVDTQAQATIYDSDLHSDAVGELEDGNNGFGYALSIESGQKLPVGSHWSLTPQAQLTYAEVDFDDFTDPFDGEVSLEDGDTLVGRLGLSADYENDWQDETGEMSRAHLYGITNVYYDFLDGTEVDVSGTSFFLENEALWGSAGLGGSLAWADGAYALYGEALAKTSLEAFGDSYSLNGTLGFRVNW